MESLPQCGFLTNLQKYYSCVDIGSCFRLPELNASYLQPQIKDIDGVIKYRSNLYKRYLKFILV